MPHVKCEYCDGEYYVAAIPGSRLSDEENIKRHERVCLRSYLKKMLEEILAEAKKISRMDMKMKILNFTVGTERNVYKSPTEPSSFASRR